MRPFIICHMSTSIDGRLHPSRFTSAAAGVSRDVLRGHYERVHDSFDADGWIVGRKTMSEMAKGSERAIAGAPQLAREAHMGNRDGRKLAIGIDPFGRVHFGKDNVGGDHAVAVLGEHVPDKHLAELRNRLMKCVLAVVAGTIVGLAMGIRNIMGLYLPPVTQSLGIGREMFGLAMAIANIVWGLGAPFAGAISDKYGTGRVIVVGALTTMAGLYMMFAADGAPMLLISGLLLGLGIAGTGVTTLIGAVGQKVASSARLRAMSAVGMGSGIGIVCALPFAHLLIEHVGWRISLLVLASVLSLMLPLAWVLSGKQTAPSQGIVAKQSLGEALREAFALPSFWMLTAGYFVCGFHVTFYSVHLPAFVIDKGMPGTVAAVALIAVGICNIIGTAIFGRTAGRIGKRASLSLIYLLRAVVFLGFLYLPMNPTTVTMSTDTVVTGGTKLATAPSSAGDRHACAEAGKWLSASASAVAAAFELASVV